MPTKKLTTPFFYVYVWIDPRTDTPIYVGKGTADSATNPYDRALRMRNRTSALVGRCLKIEADGFQVRVRIAGRFDEEQDAFAEERRLIALYGRCENGGSLFNFTDGGDGPYGYSPERSRKLSVAAKEQWATPEKRARIAASLKSAMGNSSTRARITENMKEFWSDPQRKERMRKILSAASSRTEVVEKKAANAKRGWADPEVRQRMIDGLRRGWVNRKSRTVNHLP